MKQCVMTVHIKRWHIWLLCGCYLAGCIFGKGEQFTHWAADKLLRFITVTEI